MMLAEIIGNTRDLMMSNRYLRKLVPIGGNTWLMRYWLESEDIPSAKQRQPAFKACYEAHRKEFNQVMQMLEDDFSRRTMETVISYRLDPRRNVWWGGVRPKVQYMVPEIFGPVKDEVFIDGGAFTGDTIRDLIYEFGKGKDYYKKIYAWEPDSHNREQLVKNCRDHKNIEIIPFGMWSKKDTLHFDAGSEAASAIDEKGSQELQVDCIDNLCADEKVTFIKMDIEGSEIEALRGAEHVICRDKPRLAICIYHKPEDFYEIPLLIKKMVPEYKLYIRHHSFTQYETVLYAVCD